ncbi:plasmid mobilization protein [Butyrivibrio proteoclasticus]|uniref:plasmid mobilization protein n=1 Tax=Butyrivibrio proteoclasticus TaxID=43305 RepID=UPI00047E0DCF|nr:hypothetical protein [Butyrivibrio proteoclasticus]
MAQRKYDEKRKQSNKKYMDSLTRVTIWLTPDEKAILKERADKEKKSVNCYLRNLLGYKDTPMSPMETLTDIMNDYEVFRKKLIKYCSDKGYTYIRDDISIYIDPKNSANNVLSGGVMVKDENGSEIPLSLSAAELLKIQRIEMGNESVIARIIEDAKCNYPGAVHFKGRFTEDEMKMLEKECEIQWSSTFTDGDSALTLRYKKDKE